MWETIQSKLNHKATTYNTELGEHPAMLGGEIKGEEWPLRLQLVDVLVKCAPVCVSHKQMSMNLRAAICCSNDG